MSVDDLRGLYEEAVRDAFEEGEAILAQAVAEAVERRRFHVDSHGCTVIAYVDVDAEATA